MIKRILAAAGTLALAAGLAGGLAGTASAVTPVLDGHAVTHVSGPVTGGGGVWAYARSTQFDSLYLIGTKVVTSPSVAGVSPVTAAVPGVTTYTYKLVILENGRFSAIPWSLAPNQFFGPAKIRGAASGDLSGYATYTFSDPVTGPADGSASPVDPAIANVAGVIARAGPSNLVSDSTTYSASDVHMVWIPGYLKTLAPGYWRHVAAVKANRHHKAHKAYRLWISPRTSRVSGSWVSHRFFQSWTDASYNNAGQSLFAGNITGFFGRDYR